MREMGATRLTVTRTPRHIYAQVLSADGNTVLAQAAMVLEAEGVHRMYPPTALAVLSLRR